MHHAHIYATYCKTGAKSDISYDLYDCMIILTTKAANIPGSRMITLKTFYPYKRPFHSLFNARVITLTSQANPSL